jgi:hypothetical protein
MYLDERVFSLFLFVFLACRYFKAGLGSQQSRAGSTENSHVPLPLFNILPLSISHPASIGEPDSCSHPECAVFNLKSFVCF